MLLVYDGMAKFNYVNKDHRRRTYTDTLPFFGLGTAGRYPTVQVAT